MEELISILSHNISYCVILNDNLRHPLQLHPDAMPIAGLNMAHQKAVMALEAASYYYEIWRHPVGATIEQHTVAQEDNTQRLMYLARSAFIETISCFEYCLKETIKAYPNKIILPAKNRIYLYDILKASNEAGMISDGDLSYWNGLRELRNSLVHNNAVADIDRTFTFDDEPTAGFVTPPPIVMVKGQTQTGSYNKFPEICQWAIGAYARWCSAYMESSERQQAL